MLHILIYSALTDYLSQIYFREISLVDIYLNTLRIAQAKTLLAGTDLPVYRIGQLVGFPGEASFIRLFKLKTGVTPGAYRENQKKE